MQKYFGHLTTVKCITICQQLASQDDCSMELVNLVS
jgi:hypothetical protein